MRHPSGTYRSEPSTVNVFISYSRADRSFAERLGSGIRALGAKVVSDETRLKPGESFDHALREALEASDAVVLVVPEPGTAQANSAFFEAGAARALGEPIVAVLPNADPSRVGELPFAHLRARRIRWIEGRYGGAREVHRDGARGFVAGGQARSFGQHGLWEQMAWATDNRPSRMLPSFAPCWRCSKSRHVSAAQIHAIP